LEDIFCMKQKIFILNDKSRILGGILEHILTIPVGPDTGQGFNRVRFAAAVVSIRSGVLECDLVQSSICPIQIHTHPYHGR
jgi:hypothetical protein